MQSNENRTMQKETSLKLYLVLFVPGKEESIAGYNFLSLIRNLTTMHIKNAKCQIACEKNNGVKQCFC